MSDVEKSDVSAIVAAFTHEELALYMARRIVNGSPGGGEVTLSSFSLRDGHGMPPLVATVRKDHETRYVTVREQERESGYYVVFDVAYAQDRVAYWDGHAGHWRQTHDPDSGAMHGKVSPISRLPIISEPPG